MPALPGTKFVYLIYFTNVTKTKLLEPVWQLNLIQSPASFGSASALPSKCKIFLQFHTVGVRYPNTGTLKSNPCLFHPQPRHRPFVDKNMNDSGNSRNDCGSPPNYIIGAGTIE